jgi:hypothetical protein
MFDAAGGGVRSSEALADPFDKEFVVRVFEL